MIVVLSGVPAKNTPPTISCFWIQGLLYYTFPRRRPRLLSQLHRPCATKFKLECPPCFTVRASLPLNSSEAYFEAIGPAEPPQFPPPILFFFGGRWPWPREKVSRSVWLWIWYVFMFIIFIIVIRQLNSWCRVFRFCCVEILLFFLFPKRNLYIFIEFFFGTIHEYSPPPFRF